ncbi:MAG: phage holin family protein [Clostridia bacterium]|nr:phage holin family protein [Clostridia bacterium]
MKKITELLAAVGGAIASFFCGLPPIMWVLIAVMSIDYITGILCGLMGKSQKTETGYIASHAAFMGLMKKALILLVVLLAALLDKAVTMQAGVTFEAVAGATCLWFIASEGFSILENAAAMGIPIPGILRQALDLMRKKGEVPEQKDQQKQGTSDQTGPENHSEPEKEPSDESEE